MYDGVRGGWGEGREEVLHFRFDHKLSASELGLLMENLAETSLCTGRLPTGLLLIRRDWYDPWFRLVLFQQ